MRNADGRGGERVNIEALREACHDDTIDVTQHCANRIQERSISYSDVKRAIMEGEIVEDYPDDYPHPSCLILGRGLHVVAGLCEGRMWLITAYRPSLAKWETDLKTRKAEKP